MEVEASVVSDQKDLNFVSDPLTNFEAASFAIDATKDISNIEVTNQLNDYGALGSMPKGQKTASIKEASSKDYSSLRAAADGVDKSPCDPETYDQEACVEEALDLMKKTIDEETTGPVPPSVPKDDSGDSSGNQNTNPKPAEASLNNDSYDFLTNTSGRGATTISDTPKGFNFDPLSPIINPEEQSYDESESIGGNLIVSLGGLGNSHGGTSSGMWNECGGAYTGPNLLDALDSLDNTGNNWF